MAAKFSSAIFLAILALAASIEIPAASTLVKLVGRYELTGSGGVALDWEGVSASITIGVDSSGHPPTYVIANISDSCAGSNVGGGSRWLVTMTSTASAHIAAPSHRITTFFSGPLISLYYLFSNQGGRCDPNCDFSGSTSTTFTLTRLTESRLSGCDASHGLVLQSFLTDGLPLTPPPPSARRLEFVGDSITAGDLNDNGGAAVCGNAVFNDDITLSSGALLCRPASLGGLDADCMHTAWGGITLGVGEAWGMSKLYPHTFSSRGTDAYGDWTFSRFPVDGVVVNLGTNDHPTAPALAWQAAYVTFVTDLVTTWYRNSTLAVFLAYGPMTAEYEPFVTNITATLHAQGINAHVLDLTLPHAMTGCYGHPSAADNAEIAAKAKPQIASVLGWS